MIQATIDRANNNNEQRIVAEVLSFYHFTLDANETHC